MSSVTFSTGVGGDGSTVTDDNNATTGLREGGWKTRFVPCFTQQVAVANYVVNTALTVLGGATTNSTSTTSLAIGTGSKSLTLVESGKAYIVGQYVIIASTASPSNNMVGQITSFSGTSLIVNVTTIYGSGTISAWSISVTSAGSYLPLSGGTMTGAITFAAGQTFAGTATTATNVAGGSNGTIPYQSASGTTQMLAVGTAGQLLQTNGAGTPTWVTPAVSSSGLTLLSTVTASASATVDIESTFNSTYDVYLIVASGVTCSANAFRIDVQLKISGSYDIGASNYFYHSALLSNDAASYSALAAGSGNSRILIGSLIGNAAARGVDFNIYVYTPSSTTRSKRIMYDGVAIGSAAGAPTLRFMGAGNNILTGALTGVRIFDGAGGGTYTGTFRLYGLANS